MADGVSTAPSTAAAAPSTVVVVRRRWSELLVTAGLVGCIVAVCLRLYTLEQRIERLEDEPTYRPMTPPSLYVPHAKQEDDAPANDAPANDAPANDAPTNDAPANDEARSESEAEEEEAPPESEEA